jgi:hypothetical protein
MAPEPVSVVIDGVKYVPEVVTDKPDTVVPAIDPVKQRIVETFKDVKIDDLKKVVSHDMKTVTTGNNTELDRVLTLDDETQVMFNYAARFYNVAKNDGQLHIDSFQNSKDKIKNGTIFNTSYVYIDTKPSEKNVYVYVPPTIISGGGSRKKYRKSSRRVTSEKKSSRTRKFRNRK